MNENSGILLNVVEVLRHPFANIYFIHSFLEDLANWLTDYCCYRKHAEFCNLNVNLLIEFHSLVCKEKEKRKKYFPDSSCYNYAMFCFCFPKLSCFGFTRSL